MSLKTVIKRIVKKESPYTDFQSKTAEEEQLLSSDLWANLQTINDSLGNSPDVVIRELVFKLPDELTIADVYIDGLADAIAVNQFILEPLLSANRDGLSNLMMASTGQDILQKLMNVVLPVGAIRNVSDLDNLLQALLSGETAVLADGYNRAALIGLKGGEDRGIQEPSSQTVIRGPKEGFTEDISTNIALVRRKIKDPALWLESYPIGRMTKTNVSFMYLNGTVNNQVIQEVRSRLKQIRIDGILESGYIEELIQDKTYSPFPTMYNSERPDVVAAGLLEGRVAILVDGTPFVLLVPHF
jgi:spore germination protein KA